MLRSRRTSVSLIHAFDFGIRGKGGFWAVELDVITRIRLERFTAFEKLMLEPSHGVNVLIGANGTGKTHVMKVAYAACDARTSGVPFPDKLARLFLPSGRQFGRLVKRRRGRSTAVAEVEWGFPRVRASFSNLVKSPSSVKVSERRVREGAREVMGPSVYIPVKEMLANAPGFRSLYASRSIHFEEVYSDILDRAFLPPLLGAPGRERRRLLEALRQVLEGRVQSAGEEFFLAGKQGKLEFTLLAEGLRKLGLLWLLIQNGTLSEGSILFWDEPEANLNPKLFPAVIKILLELQREGVQIFVATHDYLILKGFDLHAQKSDKIRYHAIYRDGDSGDLACRSTSAYLEIAPNAIAEAFSDAYDREIRRSLGVDG